jgi:RimJ/RimL family protein N-acetyltransferase
MGAPHRGNGYLGEALAAVIAHWFATGHDAMGWSCLVGNIASARTARRAAFRFTGTRPSSVEYRDGSRPDSWHAVLRRDHPREPQPGWPAEVEG